MTGRIEHFGVDAGDPFLRVAGLNGGVAVFGDADSTHGEEAGGSLGVAVAEPVFASATAKGLFDLAGLAIDDVHPLGGRVDDVEPGRVVVGVASSALGGDGGFDDAPVGA